MIRVKFEVRVVNGAQHAVNEVRDKDTFNVQIWLQDMRSDIDGLYTPVYYDYAGIRQEGPPRTYARGVMAAACRLIYSASRSRIIGEPRWGSHYPNDHVFEANSNGIQVIRAMQHLGEAPGSVPQLFVSIPMQATLPVGWNGAMQKFSPSFLGMEPTPENNTYVAMNYMHDSNEYNMLVKLGECLFVPADLIITR